MSNYNNAFFSSVSAAKPLTSLFIKLMQQPFELNHKIQVISRTCDEKLSCNQEKSRQISLKI